MATRNLVPRVSGEGGIGTEPKPWASGVFHKLYITGEGGVIAQVTTGSAGGGGGGGSSTSAEGPTTAVQFNIGGGFSGSESFIFNPTGGYFSGASGYIDQLYVTGTGWFAADTLRVGKAKISQSSISDRGLAFSVPCSSGVKIESYKGSRSTLAYDTGARQLLIRAFPSDTGASGWNRLSIPFSEASAPDLGAIPGSDQGFYTAFNRFSAGHSFIMTDRDVWNSEFNAVHFGTVASGINGAMRQGSDGILEAYSPASSSFQDLAVGISATVDTGDQSPKGRDIEYTNPTTSNVYSVIDGDSDLLGVNGIPVTQGFQSPVMGGVPFPTLIDGGNF